MSRNIIHQAIRNYRAFKNARCKSLMHTLVTYGNDKGGNIFPGRQRLAADENCSILTITRLLKHLERDNFIVTTNKKGGRGNVTHYEIVLSTLGIEPESHDFTPPLSVTPPDNTYTNGYRPVTPETAIPNAESPDEQRQKLLKRLEQRQKTMERHPTMKLYRGLYEDTLHELQQLEREIQHG